MEPKDEGLLKEHKLARKLAKRGAEEGGGGAVKLKGYVGSSDSPDTVCLYLTLDFDECVYVKKNDILHVEEAPESELEMGGTYIWVKKDAEITHSRTESIKEKAGFLEGEIARAQLRPSEMAGLPGQMIPIPPRTIRSCGIVPCGPITFPRRSCLIDCGPITFPRRSCLTYCGPTIVPIKSCLIRCGPISLQTRSCLAVCFTIQVCEAVSATAVCEPVSLQCPIEQSLACEVEITPDLTTQLKDLADQVKAQNAQLRKLMEKGTGQG
jgi:hypothetical protein